MATSAIAYTRRNTVRQLPSSLPRSFLLRSTSGWEGGRTWVSAALPLRQQYTRSCRYVSLSVTLLAMYDPVVVRESAPMTTPPLNATAIIEVYRPTGIIPVRC
jgi:hypothetical protein